MTFGNGKPVPPSVVRECIELQRVGSRVAARLKMMFADDFRINIEADISPSLMRFVIQYTCNAGPQSAVSVIEVNLLPGHPIDDPEWIDSEIEHIADMMRRGESDLVIPTPIERIRFLDTSGHELFDSGQ
jgi:hypothetical protein